ncbi:MAG: MCE family protein [Actinobacteria bacterium]|nr:MAG: MCE family protein [Actinomycetota bacterium]
MPGRLGASPTSAASSGRRRREARDGAASWPDRPPEQAAVPRQRTRQNGKTLEGNGRAPTGAAKLLPLRAWRAPGFSPKAFSERNPYIIGTIALAIILVFTAGALFLQSGVFSSTFETTALFPNTAGISANDQVMVAGIKVGKVGAAHLDGNQVRVALDIKSGTQVPADSTAEVKIQSFLGTKAVYLNPGTDWAHQLHQGSVITKTKVPFDLNQLANTAVPALNQTNSAQINELLGDPSTTSTASPRR